MGELALEMQAPALIICAPKTLDPMARFATTGPIRRDVVVEVSHRAVDVSLASRETAAHPAALWSDLPRNDIVARERSKFGRSRRDGPPMTESG